MALPASPTAFERGSRYGAGGIYYPAEEERLLPLSEQALRLIAYLYYALCHVFQHRDDLHVGADQFIYWQPGDIAKKIAPDGFVIQGVPREPPRAVIRLWEEAVPDLVIEISSEDSRADDRGSKRDIYQNVLRCPEYLIYDDDLDEDLDELLFFRLEQGHYHLQAPNADGRFHSASLGISFAKDRDVLLRVFDLNGAPVPEAEEWVALYQQVQQQMERERRKAELADLRADAERDRAEALAQEVERLRKLLEAKKSS